MGHAHVPAGRARTLEAVELALELAPTEFVLVGSTGTVPRLGVRLCFFSDLPEELRGSQEEPEG